MNSSLVGNEVPVVIVTGAPEADDAPNATGGAAVVVVELVVVVLLVPELLAAAAGTGAPNLI